MKHIFLALWFLLLAIVGASAAGAEEEVGYVLSFDLKGADVSSGTSIVRLKDRPGEPAGQDIKPKVWMPLYVGDIVFIRAPASRVTLDLAGIGRYEVTGAQKRYTVSDGTDASWWLRTQIAELFGAEEGGESPTNLVSKGDGSLSVPMAVRGPNMILRDKRPVWIAWSASKGPYGITLDVEGNRIAVATQDAAELEMPLPAGVRSRFTVIITDALGKRAQILFRLRNSVPQMPKALRDEAARHGAALPVAAGWLAAQGQGEWRFEVARMLRDLPKDDKSAALLLKALAAGWRPAKG
ncbi:hypothetical protein BH10PSE7_BH10PSE7_37230 [soil metagenome]